MNCILNSLESYYFDLCGNSRITTLAHSMSSIKLFGLFFSCVLQYSGDRLLRKLKGQCLGLFRLPSLAEPDVVKMINCSAASDVLVTTISQYYVIWSPEKKQWVTRSTMTSM